MEHKHDATEERNIILSKSLPISVRCTDIKEITELRGAYIGKGLQVDGPITGGLTVV